MSVCVHVPDGSSQVGGSVLGSVSPTLSRSFGAVSPQSSHAPGGFSPSSSWYNASLREPSRLLDATSGMTFDVDGGGDGDECVAPLAQSPSDTGAVVKAGVPTSSSPSAVAPAVASVKPGVGVTVSVSAAAAAAGVPSSGSAWTVSGGGAGTGVVKRGGVLRCASSGSARANQVQWLRPGSSPVHFTSASVSVSSVCWHRAQWTLTRQRPVLVTAVVGAQSAQQRPL